MYFRVGGVPKNVEKNQESMFVSACKTVYFRVAGVPKNVENISGKHVCAGVSFPSSGWHAGALQVSV